jgi:NADH-quinone oxidoreductase subunit E
MAFTEEIHTRAKEIIARYPVGHERSALLPLLHLVQSEQGYVSPEGVTFCADQLGITRAQVGAVATFYTMYKRRPTGDWLVSVCTNTMCGVLGGDRTFQTLSERLGVGHDETTEDGTITLEHAECLAACDYAPVVTVNYEFFDNVQAEQALELVAQLKDGQRPTPSRGSRLCTLKEMSIQLAGFAEERDGALADGPAGEPTLRGNLLAEQYGISVAGFDPNTPIPTQADREAAKAEAEAKAAAEKAAAPAPPPSAAPVVTSPAESAGLSANKPASDAKPAGDVTPGREDAS